MQVSLFICSRDLVHSGWECESASTPCADCFPTHQLWPGVYRIAVCSTGEFGTSYMSAGEKNLHFKFEVHQTRNQICWGWSLGEHHRDEPVKQEWQVLSWIIQFRHASILLDICIPELATLSIIIVSSRSILCACYCFRLRQWNMPYKKHPLLLMVSLVPRPHPLSGPTH